MRYPGTKRSGVAQTSDQLKARSGGDSADAGRLLRTIMAADLESAEALVEHYLVEAGAQPRQTRGFSGAACPGFVVFAVQISSARLARLPHR